MSELKLMSNNSNSNGLPARTPDPFAPPSPMNRMMHHVNVNEAPSSAPLLYEPPASNQQQSEQQQQSNNVNNNRFNLSRYEPLRATSQQIGRRKTWMHNQPPSSPSSSSSHPSSPNTNRYSKPRSKSFDHTTELLAQQIQKRRSSFTTPMYPLSATIVFLDLEGYSKSSDVHQRQLTCDFMSTLRNLLTFAYGTLPQRGNIDNYVILPTGDGAAVIVIRPPERVIRKYNSSSSSSTENDDGEEQEEEENNSPIDYSQVGSSMTVDPNNCNNNINGEGEYYNNIIEELHNDDGGECNHTEFHGECRNCTASIDIEQELLARRQQNQEEEHKKMKKDKEEEATPPKGIFCEHCSTQSLRTTEETALWIGSTLLLWASHRQIGLRVGLNSGELSIVEDPYGDPNVCGDAINMAARIMDTALPGQILASASTVVPNLNVLLAAQEKEKEEVIGEGMDELDLGRGESQAPQDVGPLSMDDGDELDVGREHNIMNVRRNNRIRKRKEDCTHCPRIRYEIAQEPSEVVVKHGVTTNVQSITVALHPLPRPEDLPPELQQPMEGGPPLMPTPTLARTDSGTEYGGGEDDELSRLHPLMKTKNNPKKQSFASLSSLQPAMGRQGSFRDSIRNSRDSLLDSSKSSQPTTVAPGKNASRKVSDVSPNAQTRMSMMSQLSTDESDNVNNTTSSSKTSNASSTNPLQQQQQQQHCDVSQHQQTHQPQHVGNHKTPATKWYMKIKPTEMQSSSTNQIKPKVLPQELIRRHQRIAFLGIMHDNLSKGFINILESNPNHRWDQVYILFPSDECLKNHLARNYRDQPVEKLIYNKQECRKTLLKLLSPVVNDLRFLQYDQLMHCGSYWDWRDPGGFIHISPLTWGANPKTCPAMNYYWNSRVPSPEYRVYREGLEYLLGTAQPFDDILEEGVGYTTIDEE